MSIMTSANSLITPPLRKVHAQSYSTKNKQRPCTCPVLPENLSIHAAGALVTGNNSGQRKDTPYVELSVNVYESCYHDHGLKAVPPGHEVPRSISSNFHE